MMNLLRGHSNAVQDQGDLIGYDRIPYGTTEQAVQLHDALSDTIVPPLGRANHLQGMLCNISLQQHRFKLLDGYFTQDRYDELFAFIQQEFMGLDVIVNYTTIGKENRVFYITVTKNNQFYALFFGGKDADMVAAVLPAASSFDRIQDFFARYIPEKEYLIHHYSYGGEVVATKIKEKSVCAPAAFYPFIPEGPDALIKGFYESSSNVLIMTGPAGTGKSNLARYFTHHSSDTFYLLDNDAIYQNPEEVAKFLAHVRKEAQRGRVTLFLEEMDKIVMSKHDVVSGALTSLLSIASGVLALDIKIVITANLTTQDKLAPELARIGRTYRVINCRTLDAQEGNAARESIGLAAMDLGVKPITLAEALNAHNAVHGEVRRNKTPLGFVPA